MPLGTAYMKAVMDRDDTGREPRPTEALFRLSDEWRRELESALTVWTTHIRALSKMVTRIKVDWQVRECLPSKAREAAAA